MDNEKEIIKHIKGLVKRLKFSFDYRNLTVLSESEGNDAIKEMIKSGKPGFIGRGGATEMRCIKEYLDVGFFSVRIREEISMLSGVFPTDNESLRKFCEIYIDAISKADIVSLWGVGAESEVVHKYCQTSQFTKLHALEPYYFSNPWSAALEGKKVLIVHPFKKSIESQYKRREKIFPEKDILPKFKSLDCIEAVQSIAGEKTKFNSWFDAMEYMKREISSKEFDVAIIGAGAYGLPLAAYCKEMGKQAVQMSGATQILFGIKGKRWDNHSVISKFYNEAWTRPLKSETPSDIKKVEGGSYW